MKVLLLLMVQSIHIISTDSFSQSSIQNEDSKNLRIYYGKDAKKSQFPWYCGITSDGEMCGASVIANEWILTAAHCTIDSESCEVIFYDKNHNKIFSIKAKQIFIEPTYTTESSGRNDISLVQLESPLTFSESIQPVKLPPKPENLYVNEIATVCGYGVNENKEGPDILQWTEHKIISNAECTEAVGSSVYAKNMCGVGYNNQNEKICFGDSGGPLVILNGENTIQIGIVSHTYGCEDSTYPDGYARVSSYLDWISKTTGIKIETIMTYVNNNNNNNGVRFSLINPLTWFNYWGL